MAKSLNAFVISPIGEQRSAQRAHADWVLNEIIRKACHRLGPEIDVRAERSDDTTLPGDVMGQVINAIVRHRVVFAVLAYDRPNVYYELGLAIAAGRPVIILRHKREKTHFDVKGFRVIDYAYPPDPAALDNTISQVAQFVRSVLDEPDCAAKVFTELDPLGQNYRDYEFKPAFNDLKIPDYSKIFHEAQNFIALQGISLWHFARPDFRWKSPSDEEITFFDLIRAKVLFEAVNVHVVMMDAGNPALPQLMKFSNTKHFAATLSHVRQEIAQSFNAWSGLSAELADSASEHPDGRKGQLHVHMLSHGVVNYRLTLTDQRLVLSPYINYLSFNGHGPALVCQKETVFYDRLSREYFDRIVSNDLARLANPSAGTGTV